MGLAPTSTRTPYHRRMNFACAVHSASDGSRMAETRSGSVRSTRARRRRRRRAPPSLILNNTRPDRSRCELTVDYAGQHCAHQSDDNQDSAEDRGDEHEVEYPHDDTPITTRTAERTCAGNFRSSERASRRWTTMQASGAKGKDGERLTSVLHRQRLCCLARAQRASCLPYCAR